ncbi:MAG TPA: DUF2510 domain-containing protein, partial [Acidimicrobiales bacterium]
MPGTVTPPVHAPGWRPDPFHHARLRYWDGEKWTRYVADPAPALEPYQVNAISNEIEGFVTLAERDGAVDTNTAARLRARLAHWRSERQRPANLMRIDPIQMESTSVSTGQAASGAAATPVRPPPTERHVPEWHPEAAPIEARASRLPAPELTKAPAPEPRRAPAAIGRLQKAIASDFAIHGLAYLGILLLFTGITGFVIFTFGTLTTAFRPVAEVLVPAALFGAAAYLKHRGARVAGTALAVAGGAVLPVVAIATIADGAAFPPDATGVTLALLASALAAACALVLSWLSTRPGWDELRYEVVPVAWLAAALLPAMATDGLAGKDIAAIGSAQVSALAAAVAVGVLLARVAPEGRLTRPTMLVSGPGVVVTLALLAATGTTGWSGAALVIVGLSTLVAAEGLSPLYPAFLVATFMAGGLSLATVGAATEVEPAWAGAIGALAFVGLLEWQGWRRPVQEVLAITALPVAACAWVVAGGAGFDAWALVTASSGVAAWAHVRRFVRVDWLDKLIVDGAAAT